jgi:hypothetical protein
MDDRGSVSGRVTDFSSRHRVWTGSGAHPVSCLEAGHSPPHTAEINNAWSYTSTHPYVFMAFLFMYHFWCRAVGYEIALRYRTFRLVGLKMWGSFEVGCVQVKIVGVRPQPISYVSMITASHLEIAVKCCVRYMQVAHTHMLDMPAHTCCVIQSRAFTYMYLYCGEWLLRKLIWTLVEM